MYLDTRVVEHLRLTIPLIELRRLFRAPPHFHLQVQIGTRTLPKSHQLVVECGEGLGQSGRCFHMLKIPTHRHSQIILQWVRRLLQLLENAWELLQQRLFLAVFG